MSIRRFIISTFLITVPLGALASEPGGGTLTLGDALALTLKQNPDLSVYNWDIRAAEARIIQARLRPNPELSFESENFTGSGSFKNGAEMENTLRLSQLVELGGKRAARIIEAQAGRESAEWEYQIKRVEVLKNTTQTFIQVLAVQRQLALAEEVAKVAEEILPLVNRRIEIGKASTVEGPRANVAVASARIGVEQTKRELLAAKGRLAAQWGAKQADFGGVGGSLDTIKEIPSIDALRTRLLDNPQLTRWSTEREKRKATLASVKAQGRPDLTFMVGPRVIGKGEDTTAVAGFSLPLPLFNRNQGNIAAAKADLGKIEEEKRAAEARAFAALNDAYQKLMAAAGEVEILSKSVLPSAKQAMDLLLEGYGNGRFGQFELLDGRRSLNEARSQQLRALADYHQALAEIEALTARPVELSRNVALPNAARAKPLTKK